MEDLLKPSFSSIYNSLITRLNSVSINLIVFINNVDDTLLFYTILCTLEDEGPIICKLHFSKLEDDRFKFLESEINRIRSIFNIYKHPNVLVYDKIFNV